MNKLDESQEGRGGSWGSSGTDLAAQCLGLLRPATAQRTPGRREKGDLESSGTRPPGHRDKQSLPCPHDSAYPSLVPARAFVGSVSSRSRCPPPTSCNKERPTPQTNFRHLNSWYRGAQALPTSLCSLDPSPSSCRPGLQGHQGQSTGESHGLGADGRESWGQWWGLIHL